MTIREAAIITNAETWGFVPTMLDVDADMPLWEQVHNNYSHGGGWNDFNGFDVVQDDRQQYLIKYPGDPVYHERGRIEREQDMLIIFDYSWVMWVDKTDPTKHKIARID